MLFQVVSNSALVKRAEELQQAFDSGQVGDYCEQRATQASDDAEKTLWCFLQAHSLGANRKRYAAALGIGTYPLRFVTLLSVFLGCIFLYCLKNRYSVVYYGICNAGTVYCLWLNYASQQKFLLKYF